MTDYYNQPALSYSGVKKYLTDGPHSFWRHTPLNPMRVVEEPSPAMIRGKLAHTLLLEPEKANLYFAVKEKVDGRTSAGKQYNSDFAANCNGREIIDTELFGEIKSMIAILKNNADFKKATAGDWSAEEEFLWTPEDNLARKAKMDFTVIINGEPIIFDYKTCQNCDPLHFRKDVINYRYYIQDVFYKRAYEIKYGKKPRFIFIAQESDYHSNVALYELTAADLAVGERELDRVETEIKARLLNQDWKPYRGGIQQLDMPTWFYTRQQEEEANAI